MTTKTLYYFLLLCALLLMACQKEEKKPDADIMQLISIKADDKLIQTDGSSTGIPVNSTLVLKFSTAVDTSAMHSKILLMKDQSIVEMIFQYNDGTSTILCAPIQPLDWLTTYTLRISETLSGSSGERFDGFELNFITENGKLYIQSITINDLPFIPPDIPKGVDFDNINIKIDFTESMDGSNLDEYFSLLPISPLSFVLSENKRQLIVQSTEDLDYYRKYEFRISQELFAENGFGFDGFSNIFITGLDSSQKLPAMSDEALLDLVQHQTFKYFWDYAHPVSGLTRERHGSGEVVTTGGSGFGLMAIIVGAERGFISRQDAIDHFSKVTEFLLSADRFHGAWPHWMNGSTGKTIPFSNKDDGADLVETSFMAAGLLTVRQYLNPSQTDEMELINTINQLLDEIEWDWFTRGGQQVLYWHWSPNHGWDMNMQIRGYNEALITYFMAATSTTHPIDASVYHNGWARTGGIVNGNSFYGIKLPLGYNYGGPLFFTHYSFLGLNPTQLIDQYADYWEQNQNHTLINQKHCELNPLRHLGYSAIAWGLTASDDPYGYGVHEPTRDNGTLTPSAAISSMPFTPDASQQALRHFYYILGDKLWGEFGFYDAFNPGEAWWANSYLAIDQGPIVIMIENYRTGLCWDLFMSAPEVSMAMKRLGFTAN